MTEETAVATNMMAIAPAKRVSVAYIIVIVLSSVGAIHATVIAGQTLVAVSWGIGFGTGVTNRSANLMLDKHVAAEIGLNGTFIWRSGSV